MAEAADYEAAEMCRLLPGPVYQTATGVLETITPSDELRLICDDRAKEEKDKFSFLKDAVAEAQTEARAQALAEGMAGGELIGRIKMIWEFLGVPKSGQAELAKMNSTELESVLKELKRQLQSRD